MIDGAEIVTVDDLAPSSDRLHPVQRALVDAHASQCGFCTPGFVMSLFTLYHSGKRPDRAAVNDGLAGNLCRCTGYRPIADAALSCCTGEAGDACAERAPETAARLASIAGDADLFIGNDDTFFAAPATEDALAALCVRHPDATIVGGATDVGLWITKQLRPLPRIVHTGRVASLHEVRETSDRIEIGAAATYTEAEDALRGIDPDVGEMLRRLGSKQVRAAGTVGGNIANGSPIGDSPPVLIALDASIALRRGERRRRLPLEDFFLGYGRQDRAPGEILTRIIVPRLAAGEHFRCYKISKRFDQDISALLGAFRFRIEKDRVTEARIAYGGMAAVPKRASNAECAAAGASALRPRGLARRRRSAHGGLLPHRRPPRERRLPDEGREDPVPEGACRDRGPSHGRDPDHRPPGHLIGDGDARREEGGRCECGNGREAFPIRRRFCFRGTKPIDDGPRLAHHQRRAREPAGPRRGRERRPRPSPRQRHPPRAGDRRLRRRPARARGDGARGPRLRHGRRPRPCPRRSRAGCRARARNDPLARSRRGAGLSRGAGGADRGRRPRNERLQPRRARRRSDPRRRRDPLSRTGGVRGCRRDPRRGPPRRAPRPHRGRCPSPRRHRRPGPRRRGRGAGALRVPARRARARHRRRPAPDRRPPAHRRPGPLLSRRAGRPGRPRRGRRDAGPFLHPASLRGAAPRRRHARRAQRRGGVRMPADGRRIRRQGVAGRAMGLPRRAGRAGDRTAGEAAPRPRRRHDHDRQAPRLPRRLALRLRPRGRARRRRRRAQRPLRLLGRPLPRRERPGHVPRRQRLLLPGGADPLPAGAHRHGVEHRVSAASAGRRACCPPSG